MHCDNIFMLIHPDAVLTMVICNPDDKQVLVYLPT